MLTPARDLCTPICRLRCRARLNRNQLKGAVQWWRSGGGSFHQLRRYRYPLRYWWSVAGFGVSEYDRGRPGQRVVILDETLRFDGVVGCEVVRPAEADGLIPELGLDVEWPRRICRGRRSTARDRRASVKSGSSAASPRTAMSWSALCFSNPAGNSRLSFRYPTACQQSRGHALHSRLP